MPRSTKAGPARSRRRPDPATRYNIGQLICPVDTATANDLGNQGELVLTYANPATGLEYGDADLMATGQPSTLKLVRDTGDVYDCTVSVDVVTAAATYTSEAGLPAGNYIFLTNGLDTAVRYTNGGWTGTTATLLTIL